MLPIWSRTKLLISRKCSGVGMGENSWGERLDCGLEEEGTMKAKGRWPFMASGMPMTEASATRGEEVMACSMAPVEC